MTRVNLSSVLGDRDWMERAWRRFISVSQHLNPSSITDFIGENELLGAQYLLPLLLVLRCALLWYRCAGSKDLRHLLSSPISSIVRYVQRISSDFNTLSII
jgi:hypothetical protein